MNNQNEEDQPIYNQSVREAYATLLKQQHEKDSQFNDHLASAVDESEFSDHDNAIMKHDENDDDDDYISFKRSILQNIDHGHDSKNLWLDDEDDTDYEYNEDADRTFIDSENECQDYVYDESRKMSWNKYKWMIICILFVTCWYWGFSSPIENKSIFTPDINKRINQLQIQMNQLIHDNEVHKKTYKSEMDSNLKLIIQQFEKNIKNLLPNNIKDLKFFQSKLNKLEVELDNISSIKNFTQWQSDLIYKLNEILPDKIPMVVKDSRSNANSSMLMIPELHDYLSLLIPQIIQQTMNENLPKFKYDMNDYVREVLSDEFQFIDRDFFLQKLDDNLKSTKEEIYQELEKRLSTGLEKPPSLQQFSSVLLKKLVYKIYNSNQHMWESNLNMATFAQGAKILNHLCSKTHHGIIGPADLLQDCLSSCSSTYWYCEEKCYWTIRLAQPMYLIKLSYLHGKFINNLQIMTAAPKKISIYVKLHSSLSVSIDKWSKDSSFIYLGTWVYDIFDTKIKKEFQLPTWFIQGKYLVRSIAFQIDENHGNQEITAIRKFIVNAVTPKDLTLMDKFPDDWNSQIPEYSIMIDEQEKLRSQRIAKLNNDAHSIKSFGQDEIEV